MQGDSRDPGPASQSSSLLSHYRKKMLRKGRLQMSACPEVWMGLTASLGTRIVTFPLSFSTKHLPSKNGTVSVTNTPQSFRILTCSTLQPAPGPTSAPSSKCSLQCNPPCPTDRAGGPCPQTTLQFLLCKALTPLPEYLRVLFQGRN